MKKLYYIAVILFFIGFGLIATGNSLLGVLSLWGCVNLIFIFWIITKTKK